MIDAYVTGNSLPALAAALDLAELGLRVRVVDRGDAVRALDGPVRDGDGVLHDLLAHLAAPIAEGDDVDVQVTPLPVPRTPVWVVDARGGWTRQPLPAVAGVPAVPLAHEALAILGSGAAFRAYLDRIAPLLTIGKTRRLGALVDKRLGPRVRERLVEPFAIERFGVGAADVDAAVAAPGLNEAMSRSGALTGGVLAETDRDVARETAVVPTGGWGALDAALRSRLRAYGVDFTDAAPAAVERSATGWRVRDDAGTVTEARALVVDVGRSAAAAPPALDAETAEALRDVLQTMRVRTRARVRVIAPDDAPEDAVTLLRCVTVPGEARVGAQANETWAVRLERQESGHWVAMLAGPAATPDTDHAAAPVSVAALARVLEAAAVREAPGAEWTVLQVSAEVPTLEDRARERSAAAAFAEDHASALLVVGRRVHEDSLAAAVQSAREGSVPLRRHLTGIAD